MEERFNKHTALAAVIAQMKEDLNTHARSSMEAREGATHSEVKSEGKYDTRSTESSYLARGHAMHFEAMRDDLAELQSYRLPEFGPRDTVNKGALVGITLRGFTELYFILPKGGGIEVRVDGIPHDIVVMTSKAPLFERLKGLKVGDKVRIGDAKFQSNITSLC